MTTTSVSSSVRTVTDDDRTDWDKKAMHPLQSWAWGDFRNTMGVDVVRFATVNKNGQLREPWQMTVHPIPHTPWTIGYSAKCPLPSADVIRYLTRIGEKNHAVSILLEPDAVRGSKLLKTRSLVTAKHPLFTKYTFVLDLTKSEDALLSAMHPKTRYNIRVATRHGVVVAENNTEDAFDAYLRLSEETTIRQGFYAHDRHYHRTMWNILHKAGIAHLWTATLDKEILATWIIFTWKDRLYYPYGASSRSHREAMAPNLLLWEIAQWGKQNGFSAFDLWGALGPDPDPNDPWYGFHRFKEGYHPDLVEYLGSYDLIIRPAAYRLYGLADTVRSGMLSLRARMRKPK